MTPTTLLDPHNTACSFNIFVFSCMPMFLCEALWACLVYEKCYRIWIKLPCLYKCLVKCQLHVHANETWVLKILTLPIHITWSVTCVFGQKGRTAWTICPTTTAATRTWTTGTRGTRRSRASTGSGTSPSSGIFWRTWSTRTTPSWCWVRTPFSYVLRL